MSRTVAHIGGALSLLVTAFLWLSMLDPTKADRIVDSAVGVRYEYGTVLGAGFVAMLLSFVAAVRTTRWWYLAMVCSLGTLGVLIYGLWP